MCFSWAVVHIRKLLRYGGLASTVEVLTISLYREWMGLTHGSSKGRRILIATTSIISGASLINNMADDALGRTDNKGAAAS